MAYFNGQLMPKCAALNRKCVAPKSKMGSCEILIFFTDFHSNIVILEEIQSENIFFIESFINIVYMLFQ